MMLSTSRPSGWFVVLLCTPNLIALNDQFHVSAFSSRGKLHTSLTPTITTTTPIRSSTISVPFVADRNSNSYITSSYNGQSTKRRSRLFLSAVNDDGNDDETLLSDIKAMRVKELKVELKSLGISTEDAFEKEELVKRLYKARKEGRAPATTTTTTTSTSTTSQATTTTTTPSSSVISVPLTFRSLDSFRSVDATNSEEVFIRPSPGQFASLRADLPNNKSLTLLVDTACSGVVLRPSSVQNLNIPTFQAPGSMTAAGGTVGNTQVAQLDRVIIAGYAFGPMPAAVQDIGALPSVLDGIIGLSFLNQFACVDIDFGKGNLILYKKEVNPTMGEEEEDGLLSVLSEGPMKLARIGIWIADVTFDGKNPVKMLVDTGAAATLLNWKGVEDMGLSRTSPDITLNSNVGAVGADNVALRLTHRHVLKKGFKLEGGGGEGVGVDLAGDTVNIDIGDIPVLDVLKGEGVGGILGADLFMRCDVVRLILRGGAGKIKLLKRVVEKVKQQVEEQEPFVQQSQSVDAVVDPPVAPKKKKKKKRRSD